MYEKHWRLREKPFENDQNIAFLFQSKDHREALVRLLYAIMESKGCVVLTGDAGCGKTFILNALAEELSEKKVKVAMIKNPAIEPLDLLRQIAQTFSVRNVHATKSELITGLEQYLSYYRERGVRAVLMIDDADLIRDDRTYEELRLLLNLEQMGRPLLTLVLAGQPRLKSVVRGVPGLAQRVALSCKLPPLRETDVTEYILHRLSQVSGNGAEIFNDRAIREVYRTSRGVPRLINHLCDLSLLVGASEGKDVIDPDVVQKARSEFKEIHQ
ncbi:MAG: ExeA family protein [Planctomycetota bacterium]|jgi:general secretion pathway protein A